MSGATTRRPRPSVHLLAAAGAVGLLVAGCAAPAGTEQPPAEGGGNVDAGSAACEGSAAVDLAERAGSLTGDERETLLLEEAVAARDGAIDLYTEINDPQAITEAFEEKYGDLTVNVYRAGSEQIRQRILEESDAAFSGADLIEMDTLEMAILDQNELLAPAASPLVDELSEAARFDNYIGDRLSYIVPGWNSELVAPEDVPTTLAEYADFDGALALEGSDVFWFAGMVMYMEENEGMSRDEAVQVFKDLAANADITSGHTTTTELVVAGQYALAPNHYVHRLLELQEKGAPIEWAPVSIPVVAEVTATSVHCLSDNPAGAMLLQDFILSADGGQQIFVDEGRTPANESLAQQTLGGVEIEPVTVSVADVVADYTTWSELWDEVVRGGNAG